MTAPKRESVQNFIVYSLIGLLLIVFPLFISFTYQDEISMLRVGNIELFDVIVNFYSPNNKRL